MKIYLGKDGLLHLNRPINVNKLLLSNVTDDVAKNEMPVYLTFACQVLYLARKKHITSKYRNLKYTFSLNKFVLDFTNFKNLVQDIAQKGLIFNTSISNKIQPTRDLNIQGKIKDAVIIANEEDFIKNSNQIYIYDTYMIYSKVNYPIVSDFHKYKFIIPVFEAKTIINPDYDTYSKYAKIFENNSTRDTKINRATLLEYLLKGIKVFTNNDKEIIYADISNLIKDYNNQKLVFELAKAYRNSKNIIFFEGAYYIFNIDEFRDNLKTIYLFLTGDDSKKFEEILNTAKTVHKETNYNYIDKLKDLKFNATLKPHQEVGVSWMYGLYLKNIPGCILGDKMGLGKTIQTIAALALINKSVTIICPASLIGNWANEIKAFYPKLINKTKIYSYEGSVNKTIDSDVIVYDEAQKMKNEATALATKARFTKAQFKILLTGTPLENSIADVHSLIRIIMLESDKSLRYILSTFRNNSISLTRSIIDGIYLAREMDSSILTAKLIIKNESIQMNDYELKVEKNIREIYKNKIQDNINSNVAFYNDAIVGFLRLRQLTSNHRSLPKDLIPANVDYNDQISKLNYCKDLVSKIRSNKEKVIIFTQFTHTIELLKEELGGESKCLLIDGTVNKHSRTMIVNEFQNNRQYDVILISLKAGATGLTLTAANHVIMYDLWWNPAIEAQAFARAYRIGQTKDVTCYRLVCSNSIIDPLVLKTVDKKIGDIQSFEQNDNKITVNTPKEIINSIFEI